MLSFDHAANTLAKLILTIESFLKNYPVSFSHRIRRAHLIKTVMQKLVTTP
jgi:hypothetical protein